MNQLMILKIHLMLNGRFNAENQEIKKFVLYKNATHFDQ